MERDTYHPRQEQSPGRSDKTERAVSMQLAGMACERVELGVRDRASGMFIALTDTHDSLRRRLPWLRHKNATGSDIYVRGPGSTGLVLVDDLSRESLAAMRRDGLTASVIVRTSPPDNHQAVIRVAPGEFAQLVEDIRAYGLREPLWVYQGRVIDGRQRYLACQEADVEPTYREWDGRGSLARFVMALNCVRRHLTATQRALIGARLIPFLAAEAKERQRAAAPATNAALGNAPGTPTLPDKVAGSVEGESPKRPRREPTDDWEQLRLFVGWPEQETYEMLRPIVLFGQTSEARARVAGARSFAFDRRTNRVVASCVQDSLARWWVVIRSTASTRGPFATRAHAERETERLLAD